MKNQVLKDINKFLVKYWDPIGIHEDPDAQNEYYSYVEDIYIIISNSKTYLTLFNYLRKVETQNIGLKGNLDKTEAAAKALFKVFKPQISDKY